MAPRYMRLAARPRRLLIALALAGVLLAAAGLRLAGRDWDQGQHLNVDEYFVTKATTRVHPPAAGGPGAWLDPQRSPLDPRAGGTLYPYGTLPLYLTRAMTAGLAGLSGDATFTGFNATLQAGRLLAGLLDAATALLVFVLGLRLWGAGAGLVAAAFYALAILPLHTSHFYISDAFLTTFLTATLLGSVAFAQTRRAIWLGLAGLSLGLALACKLTAAPMVLVGVGGWGLGVWARGQQAAGGDAGQGTRDKGQGRGDATRNPRRAVGLLALLLAAAVVGLLIGDPFGVIDWPVYLAQVRDQAAIQSGADDQWFTRKYVGTWPVLYPWGQVMLLGVGPLVGLAGTLGIGAVAVRAWRRRGPEALLLLGGGVYFASVGFLEAKWLRYFLPLVPYLCLFAAALLLHRGHTETRRDSKGFEQEPPPNGNREARGRKLPGKISVALCLRGGIVAVVLVSALLGALAFTAIYRAEHTQVQASRWIYAHVAAGSRIGTEVTTTALPLPLPDEPPPEQYTLVRMDPLADQPGAAASAALRAALAQADFVVVDATQAALTVPRLPWRYPVQIRYYTLLFQGQLGFAPVYTATSYPALGGLTIPDDGGWVDPSFLDSSHPPIHIFEKTRTLGAAEWDALFADAVRRPVTATRHAP